MATNPKQGKKKTSDTPQMLFDDALKRLLNSPPQHKMAKKKVIKKAR